MASELRVRNPDVPWKQAAAFRRVRSHDSMSIDLTTVWNVVESHLPTLREAMRRLIEESG